MEWIISHAPDGGTIRVGGGYLADRGEDLKRALLPSDWKTVGHLFPPEGGSFTVAPDVAIRVCEVLRSVGTHRIPDRLRLLPRLAWAAETVSWNGAPWTWTLAEPRTWTPS
jgi:hypothetical protein